MDGWIIVGQLNSVPISDGIRTQFIRISNQNKNQLHKAGEKDGV